MIRPRLARTPRAMETAWPTSRTVLRGEVRQRGGREVSFGADEGVVRVDALTGFGLVSTTV